MKSSKMRHSIVQVILILALVGTAVVQAMATDECLCCHGDRDMVGAERTIADKRFLLTPHGELGCLSCHEGISEEHPDVTEGTMAIACRDCHQDIVTLYQNSAHGDNAECTDCHDPHSVCGFHGKNPDEMNQTCENCHAIADMETYHQEWLPQAKLHISVLPCITCHTASSGYEIVLMLERKKSEGGLLKDYTAEESNDIQRLLADNSYAMLLDKNADQQISLGELKLFKAGRDTKDLRIRATLVPDKPSHEFKILASRYDCTFCHASGPKAAQTGYLILPTAAGPAQILRVEEGAILEAIYGSRDLYITGVTRSASLDIIGLIVIGSGFIMPIGHGTFRFLTRKNRRQREDEL